MPDTEHEHERREVRMAGVDAAVNYIRNAPTGADGTVLEFVTEDESRSTMETLPGRTVRITDARDVDTDLDREGFVLVHHVSAVSDFDRIQQDPVVDQQYIDEIQELVAHVTGATTVVMLGGGKKRYGESETEKLAPLLNAKPARYPHADNTDESSLQLADTMAAFVPDVDVKGASRWAFYNIWRATTPPPQDFPLAVCDARTLAPDDEVTVKAVTKELSGLIIHDTTSYRYNPAHRWYYFSNMTPDEVIVFKTHDTDPTRAHRVAHTAFTDPTCPTGVTTRASVEMRALALW
jgi:hypothetical protein